MRSVRDTPSIRARSRRCPPRSRGPTIRSWRSSRDRWWPSDRAPAPARDRMPGMVTSADPRPGYDDGTQHLADWSELFARMVERMVLLKSRAPRGAAVLSEHDRARIVAGDGELAGLDRAIAATAAQIA